MRFGDFGDVVVVVVVVAVCSNLLYCQVLGVWWGRTVAMDWGASHEEEAGEEEEVLVGQVW